MSTYEKLLILEYVIGIAPMVAPMLVPGRR